MSHTQSPNYIAKKFNVDVNSDWAFETNKSIDQYTHGYHRYPAKFIPQLVKKLIESYTVEGDKIVDVFAGCGTTLVESKLHKRKSVGVDINPVAELITKVKTTPIPPKGLISSYKILENRIGEFDGRRNYAKNKHSRIDYWFFRKEKNKIAFLYKNILEIEDIDIQDFFLCTLSNILKGSSKWLQSSTKPQIDPHKKIQDPFKLFFYHAKRMIEKNKTFHDVLKEKKALNTLCTINLADARNTKIRKGSIDAIITSPPYVTSYEYADIHQLTGYWFDYISDIKSFRKKFIGTYYSNSKEFDTGSDIAANIVSKLKAINTKSAYEVANYFNDMEQVSKEMYRILKPNGVACLVVGNTTMKNVKIETAQALGQMLSMQNFKIEKIIKREIPNKIIPTIRDKKTGRFTTMQNKNKHLVYPEEFIIIVRKI